MRLALCSFLLVSVVGASTLSDTILAPNKSKEFDLDLQKVDAEASIERDSWLNPIMASYTASFKTQFGVEQENYNAIIGIDQPVFKSGGIYFAIKYAKAKAYYNRLGVKLKKNGVIKQTIETVMKLQQLDLNLNQMSLEVLDAQGEVEFLQEQLEVGEVDSATLNMAMASVNIALMKKIDFANQKRDLEYQFSIVSDKKYEEIVLPKLNMLDKEAFLSHNINMKQSRMKSRENSYWHKVVRSTYLPEISLQYQYNYSEGINQTFSETFIPYDVKNSYTSYGFKASMPLFDVNMLKTVQSAKVDALKSKIQIDQIAEDEKLFFKMKISKVRALQEKKELSVKNYELYKKIYKSQENSFSSGDSNALDLQKSKHQWEIKAMEIKKIYLDEQIELLSMYEKLNDI